MSHFLDEWTFGSYGQEPAVIAHLREWVEVGHCIRIKHRKAGEAEEVQAVSARMMQVFDELHRQCAHLRFQNTIPVRWTHDRSDAAIEAKISAPGIRKIASECFDGKRNVLLLGPTGIGKTAAKALMVRRYYFAHRHYNESLRKFTFPGVHWVYSRDLAAAVAQHPLGKGEAQEVTRCRETDLLILDDLGQERDHGAILDVMQFRNQENKPTWTSSGFTLEELKSRYGEAFVRRLVEMGGEPGKVAACFARPMLIAGGGK